MWFQGCAPRRARGTVVVMAKTFIAGTPGGHAAKLRNRAYARVGACALVGLGAVVFTLPRLGWLSQGGLRAVAVALGFVVVFVAITMAQHQLDLAAKASVGARSERRVAAAIERVGPVAVLHSVILGAGGDADHLVLGPVAVCVETKTGSGEVMYQDGKLYVGRKTLKGDPLAQVRRQALAAKSVLGCFVEAVVCVVDMAGPPQTYGTVRVCSVADLPALIAAMPHRLAPDQAWARAVELAPKCGVELDLESHEVPEASSLMSYDPQRVAVAKPSRGSGRARRPHNQQPRKLQPRRNSN